MAEYNLDAETLRRMYVDDELTVAAIARALRVRKQIVCEALEQWEIPRRRHGPRRRLPSLPFTPGELRQLVQRKGVTAVAQALGVGPDVVLLHLGRETRPRGTKRGVDDAAVWSAYSAGTSKAELMERFQCSHDALRRSLRRSFLREASGKGGNQ